MLIMGANAHHEILVLGDDGALFTPSSDEIRLECSRVPGCDSYHTNMLAANILRNGDVFESVEQT